MKLEKLKNIAEIIAGQSPPSSAYNKEGDGLPFFQGKADYGTKNPIIRNWSTLITKISFPGDILISVRAPVGPVVINNIEACIGRGLSAIRVNKGIHRDYVYYYLKVSEQKIAALGVGTTFPAITQKDLNDIVIPIPEDIEDQIRIASILSKVEHLIAQRKESIALLDEFLNSTFSEMFGDPVRNEKGWERKPLSYFGVWRTGGTPLRSKVEYFKGDIPWITSGELNEVYISDSKEKITEKAILESNASKIPVGSLLLGMYDTAALKSSITTNISSCNQAIAYAKLDETLCNVLFVYYCIQIGKDYFRSQQRGVRQQNMNLTMIKNIQILYPPIALQTHFAQVVGKAEYLKVQNYHSLQELENLFASLSQKAFKGELDVSKVPVEFEERKETITDESPMVKVEKGEDRKGYNYGSPNPPINNSEEFDWDVFFKTHFANQPVTAEEAERLFDLINTHQISNNFNYEEFSSILFNALKKPNSYLQQQFNSTTKKIEITLKK